MGKILARRKAQKSAQNNKKLVKKVYRIQNTGVRILGGLRVWCYVECLSRECLARTLWWSDLGAA